MKHFCRLIIACIVIVSACKKERRAEPEASFHTQTEYGLYVPATFNAKRAEGLRYEWDFGDGTSSSQSSAQHTFVKEGAHTVTLTVSNEGGSKQATERKVIQVYKRRLTSVIVKGLLFTDPFTGKSWDYDEQGPSGAPDILLNITTASQGLISNTEIKHNVSRPALPFSLGLSSAVELGNQDYDVALIEYSPDKSYTMASWNEDLNKYADNPISLQMISGDTAVIQLNWEYVR